MKRRRIVGFILAWVAQADASTDEWGASLGGELRERHESTRYPGFGLSGIEDQSYWLQRLRAAGEIHHGQQFAAKLELISGLAWPDAGLPPTQQDPFDLLQGYVETTLPAHDGHLRLRAGRQELSLGSSRLVSVRESPNIRRSFDGLRVSWTGGSVTVDAFALWPVLPRDSTWDDSSSSAQRLWGLYATVLSSQLMGVDVYYLGLHRRTSWFAQGDGEENRHTAGSRLFGNFDHVDINLEAAWQWGDFDGASIRAWTVSADVGYTWDRPLQPRLGLKADVISGDGDPRDQVLGTFNPLFPKLPYFSEANLIAPANLIDLQPSLSWRWPASIRWEASWNVLWKYAREDAFYAPPLIPVPDTEESSDRDLGRQLSLGMEWSINDALSLGATYVDYEPGRVVRDAGGHSGMFVTAWLRLKF